MLLLCAIVVAAVALACALSLTLATVIARRRAAARRERRRELDERLAVAGSEAEARQLLLSHVNRLVPRAGAAVLTSIESQSRLEVTLGERISDTPLRGLLVGHARPEACLALRLGHTHTRDAAHGTLAGCELCGRLAGGSVCEPLRAGGRTLGSLLVASIDPFGAAVRSQLREAADRTAPLLALHRASENLERHAARDRLTALPNRRAAQETLARLCAQAGRTVTPLSVMLVDLDHFASVNDRFGHQDADGALAEIAHALGSGVRASDFVARWGGQAFLVLAPDTARDGAAALAEKLRVDVARLSLTGVGRVTASFGVASLPEDAADGDRLIARAERALGLAKALGRNQVAIPQPHPASGG